MDDLYLGQWQGFFCYGPSYGDILDGKEAEFRMFIEEYNDGQFAGRVIDWEGVGANGEISKVNGFITEHTISFVKEYSASLVIDEWGNTFTDPNISGHKVSYEGRYDPKTRSFYGSWEISMGVVPDGELLVENITSGTWRMSHQ